MIKLKEPSGKLFNPIVFLTHPYPEQIVMLIPITLETAFKYSRFQAEINKLSATRNLANYGLRQLNRTIGLHLYLLAIGKLQ